MSSILTNNSAMVALETLRGINKGLQRVQSEVSTGKQIANAKDNAAFWAISAVMDSDVSAFKGITETLSLGQATLAVARSGAETVTDVLKEMKGRIVAAQEQNVDRTKIQADVAELINQVNATVDASQFNGLNLLTNVTGNETVQILGSLNRSATGVTVSTIDVLRAPLEPEGFVDSLAGTTGVLAGNARATASIADAAAATLTIVGDNLAAGDTVATKIGDLFASYTVTAADALLTAANRAIAVATGLETALNANAAAGSFTQIGVARAGAVLTLTNNTGAAATFTAEAGGSQTPLNLIDVSTGVGAASALQVIENMIQGSINAAAAFGSSARRVEIQNEFVTKLSDSLKSGIGAIVDADLEASSARLQALQVQQQLGTQALSIANQQPQSILALFQ